MVYYQAGIGTSSKHFVTPIGVALSKTADMAIAHGLRDHVTGGCIYGRAQAVILIFALQMVMNS